MTALPHTDSRYSPRWSWWLLVIMMVGSGLPLLIAGLSGNLTIPHNDGWAYGKIAELFARTGEIHLLGWNRTSLIGQVVMLGPFGRYLVVQQVAVAALAALALYCVYYLVGQTLPRRRALLATLLVALWPGYASLAISFMSDIPALLGTFGSLALGAAALRSDSRRLLWLCLLVGAWATTVREQSLIAPATVLAYGWLTSDERHNITRREMALTGALLAVSMIAFGLWRQSLPHGDHPQFNLTAHDAPNRTLVNTTMLWFTLAVPLAPASIFALLGRRPRRPAFFVALAVGAVGLYVRIRGYSLLPGDYILAQGPTEAWGSSLFGSFAPGALQMITWVCGILMTLVVADRWRYGEPLLRAFTLFTLLLTLATAISGQALNDRYLISLAPGMLSILLSDGRVHGRSQGDVDGARELPSASNSPLRMLQHSLTLATLVALSAFSALLTLNHFAYDRAMWNAATALVKAGVPVRRIDAAQDWDGMHAPDGVRQASLMYSVMPSAAMEPQLACVLVTRAGPIDDTELLARYHYKRFLLFGSSHLNIKTVTTAPDCPTVDLSHVSDSLSGVGH